MIPRGSPDIGWRDLLSGLRDCLAPTPEVVARSLAETVGDGEAAVACLSVRSGLDLVLQALSLPHGSEVLISAITIPDMVRVLEHHGLTPVPVDLDMDRLEVPLDALEEGFTSRTRVVLAAHLFGSRMDLDGITTLAHRHGCLVFEDCAQAYDGIYPGHPRSDVVMFSFGPIKTSTALGGAILYIRDPTLRNHVRAIQAAYPVQPIRAYRRRLLRFLGLKALARPAPFAAAVALCRMAGRDHDRLISQLVRGFPGDALITKLRYRPCSPLLTMLARRRRQSVRTVVARRAALAQAVMAALPERRFPGRQARRHTHWALPLVSADPEGLARRLWAAGFDATRSASSLIVVEPPPGRRPAARAASALSHLLYLPLHPSLDRIALARMVRTINAFERAYDSSPAR